MMFKDFCRGYWSVFGGFIKNFCKAFKFWEWDWEALGVVAGVFTIAAVIAFILAYAFRQFWLYFS